MLFWRCLVIMLLTLLAILVLSFAEMVYAQSFYERQQVDPRSRVFFQCADRLQRDIELGLKPDMTDQQALEMCAVKTESVLESLQQKGLKTHAGQPEVGL